MCLVSSPKIDQTSANAAANKPLAILRNPYLDGTDPIMRARQTGVSALRIDRASAMGAPALAASPLPASQTPNQLMQDTVKQMASLQLSPQQAALKISRGINGVTGP